MVKDFVTTCDLCHREVPPDKYRLRRAGDDGMDVLLVLLENHDELDFELSENPDGAIAFDTCLDCYTRMTFNHSHALN